MKFIVDLTHQYVCCLSVCLSSCCSSFQIKMEYLHTITINHRELLTTLNTQPDH